MHKLKIFLVLTLLVFVQVSCNTTEPPIPPEDKPGRRDYTWNVDTLNYPSATLYRLWGSSPTDIWATSTGDWDKSISHFGGNRWTSYGVSGMNSPHSIYGFSSNSIYIGTSGGGIWKFNGSSWNLIAQLSKDGHSDIVFDNIWGESATDFYAFGAYPDSNGSANNSVIAHYYNNNWKMLNTEGIIGIIERIFKNETEENIYLRNSRIGNGIYPDSTLIYEYKSGNYKQLYSSVWTKGLQADISLINNEIYFILGNQIAKRVNDQFQTFLQINNSNFYQRIWGRNSKDIFLFMTDGLAHYNGTDIEYLFPITKSPTQIFGAAIFEKEVFFLVYESPTHLNLIYHGQLN